MTDFSHLNAIEDRRHNEEMRLAAAKTERERAFRRHEIAMVNKEIASERKFLGLPAEDDLPAMSDDELLRLLA